MTGFISSTPVNRVNVNGIPCIEAQSVTTGTSVVTFTFNSQFSVNPRFSGLIAVYIPQAADTAGAALPVQFSMAGSIINLTQAGGTDITGSGLTTGVHLVFYDRTRNTLQLV